VLRHAGDECWCRASVAAAPTPAGSRSSRRGGGAPQCAPTTPGSATLRQAGDDLGALRIFDPEYPRRADPAAGAVFLTVFGATAITADDPLAEPALAQGVLRPGPLQGVEVNGDAEENRARSSTRCASASARAGGFR
jgi:hypothetical protein